MKWTTGESNQYSINSMAYLTMNGMRFVLRESADVLFPAAEGWFTWTYGVRTYYMRNDGGIIYMHEFGPENECTFTYKKRAGYCRTSEGKVIKGNYIIRFYICLLPDIKKKLSRP